MFHIKQINTDNFINISNSLKVLSETRNILAVLHINQSINKNMAEAQKYVGEKYSYRYILVSHLHDN